MPSYPRPPQFGGSSGGSTMLDLIQERGRIAAQGAQNSASIWGNTIGQVGQIATGAIEQHAAQTERTKRDTAFRAAIESGDPRRIMTVLGPKDGPPVISALRTTTADGLKGYKDRMEVLRDGARGILSSPEGSRPEGYTFLRDSYISNGIAKAEEMPNTYEEAVTQGILDTAANYGREPAKPREDIRGRPGDVFLNPETMQQTAAIPPEAPKPAGPDTRSLDVQAASMLASGDTEGYNRLLRVKREMGRADDRPITINQPRPISQTAESNLIQNYTKEWDTASAPAKTITRQVGMMESGLEAARRGDRAAGAQAIIQTFNKILDPDSAVREGEYARSADGQAMMARIKGALEQVQYGGANMPLEQLETFANLARDMAKKQQAYLPAIQARIGKKADRYSIPHDLIFEGGAPAAPPAAPPAPGAAPPAAGPGAPPVRVSSPAEAARLPRGTPIILPDGSVGRVP